MTEATEIINAKIKELDTKIFSGYAEMEKTRFYRYRDLCIKIDLAAMLIAIAASMYILVAISETKEFLVLQAQIIVGYIGISIIPQYVLYTTYKKSVELNSMVRKVEGFKWLQTKAPDQQENILNIMKSRGLIRESSFFFEKFEN